MGMLLGIVAVGFVGWRLWTRLEAMRSTIAELKERVESLERWRTSNPPLVTAPVTVKPAAPISTPAPEGVCTRHAENARGAAASADGTEARPAIVRACSPADT